jgi:hypothetical protein
MTIPSASVIFMAAFAVRGADNRGDSDQDVLDLLDRDAAVHRGADVREIRRGRRIDGRDYRSMPEHAVLARAGMAGPGASDAAGAADQ